jgi:hypothetical protein
MLETNHAVIEREVDGRQSVANVLVFNSDETELAGWTELLSHLRQVRSVSSLEGVERQLGDPQITVLVCHWQDGLLEHVQAAGHAVRLIHCGPTVPDGIIEAAAVGCQVLIVERPEELVATVSRLISPRSTSLRHRMEGLTLRAGLSTDSYRLLELSNEGLSFCVAPGQGIENLLPGTVLDELEIKRDAECGLARSTAIVRHIGLVDSPPGSYSVGCGFRRSKRGDADSVGLIRDRAWCAALLRSALGGGGILLETIDDSGLPTHCSGGLVAGNVGEFTVNSVDHPFVDLDVVRGRFELGGSVYRFHATVVARAPLTLRIPRVMEETQGRSSPRCQPAAPEPMVVELLSPLLSGPAVKLVRDISGSGFSFEIDAETELFPPGMRFTRIELRSGDQKIGCRGQVRNLARIPERPRVLRCGVEFDALDESARIRLAEIIMRSRFPALRDGRDVSFEDLWDFFVRTKFMYPDKMQKLRPLLPQIRQTFDSATARSNRVFKSVAFMRDQEMVGYASGLRAYRNTWMNQHLAASAGGRGGRLLNFGVYFSQNVDLEYCKIFYRPENRWPARVFGGFARNISDPQISDLRLFSYFTLPTDSDLIPAVPGIEVVEADADQLAIAERYFVAKERGLILKANDLSRGGLQLSELDREFADIGLQRRRRVLFASDRGVPVGFALAEVSSPGLNLSELLSSFTIHLLEGAERTHEIERALLRSALELYRKAGRPFAVCLAEPDQLARYQYLPLGSVKRYACWTCHRSAYLRFCDHIDRIVRSLNAREAARASRQTFDREQALVRPAD